MTDAANSGCRTGCISALNSVGKFLIFSAALSLTGSVIGLHGQAAPAAAPAAAPVIIQMPATATPAQTTGPDWGQTAQSSARTAANANTKSTTAAEKSTAGDTGPGAMEVNAPDRPTEFQSLVIQTTGANLPLFGSDLFRNAPSTFAPLDAAQITSDT